MKYVHHEYYELREKTPVGLSVYHNIVETECR